MTTITDKWKTSFWQLYTDERLHLGYGNHERFDKFVSFIEKVEAAALERGRELGNHDIGKAERDTNGHLLCCKVEGAAAEREAVTELFAKYHPTNALDIESIRTLIASRTTTPPGEEGMSV